ncbi:phosphatidylinositol/phosphatidylcholine transfer protein SFH2-like [Primulina tabacum]|uniref:phosphatidylinositol/phosphatidylcholine transfer protein SFH2-like n=1 Tax=Primulina tabacum TaxID=48773 RepID=UPI003F59FF93
MVTHFRVNDDPGYRLNSPDQKPAARALLLHPVSHTGTQPNIFFIPIKSIKLIDKRSKKGSVFFFSRRKHNDVYNGRYDQTISNLIGIAIGVGLSTYDKASIHCYVLSHIQMNEYRDRVILPSATKKIGRYIGTCMKILDMTRLKLSALNQIKLLSAISTIDDLNYPEKTDTYYIVNAPYIFTACWKVVKPLLHERTRKKVQVLSGSRPLFWSMSTGKCNQWRKERESVGLLIMDHESLPHFCRRGGSGSSKIARNGMVSDCFSLDHLYHQQLYNYVKEQAKPVEIVAPVRHGSFNVDFPEPDPVDIKIPQNYKK